MAIEKDGENLVAYKWIVDSGSTSHVTSIKDWVRDYQAFNTNPNKSMVIEH